ncbi:MAG TPA: CGNR zinc finger domain-containing protein [Bacillota bacterium]|nr:CGNR zinc finger domain-containing protein [Clostridiaceae bacterium]HNR05628.1 CGNR zinc finger domain-containing protein [Bacillota bacterium]HNT04505.1 CGNR zinc finger domain-containing protein [Bacillota bacterium]HPX68936.1 CGNR zinc finger domain-containing protein [Bacillota bacterium]HQA66650.1 CGNR zinc finger domain-containing protein [Bacillota bacterium]
MEFLCLEFVNSSWYITHKLFSDPLMNNEWLIKLFDKWNMQPLIEPNELELAKLIDMRSRFMKLFTKIVEGKDLAKKDIELINSYMADISFFRQLQTKEGSLGLYDIPKTRNWNWFMAEVSASFARLYSSEAINRLKICQNPECGWFFIDDSKSRNRKWCDDTCASLMKVRRFRQRQKR